MANPPHRVESLPTFMSEETPSSSSPPPAPEAPAEAPSPQIPFNIGEEFSTPAKKLPPIKIVLIGVGIILVVAVAVSLMQRPHSTAIGSIDDIVSVEIPDQNAV